jgi:hypothetical protein
MKKFAVLGILSGLSAAALLALTRYVSQRRHDAFMGELSDSAARTGFREGVWDEHYSGKPNGDDIGHRVLEIASSPALRRAAS